VLPERPTAGRPGRTAKGENETDEQRAQGIASLQPGDEKYQNGRKRHEEGGDESLHAFGNLPGDDLLQVD